MTSMHSRSFALAATLALAAVGGPGRPTLACEAHSYVRAEIDPLPPELAGMRIEVHRTMGAQLVIENRTPRTVEVLDANRVPFVRIGPAGIEANATAASWYLTYSPAAVVPASARRGGAPRWVRASGEPNFGWFESRLDASRVALRKEVLEAGRSTELGRWSVPVIVDGRPAAIAGRFVYEPPPDGGYEARLLTPAEIAPGVRVRLLPGRSPGLMVESASERPLLVLGADGEPFLRIGPSGVEANARSRTWWQSGRAGGRRGDERIDPAAPPDWRRVASAPRFSWIDARAQVQSAGGANASPIAWEVPMRIGDEPTRVAGELVWKSISSNPAALAGRAAAAPPRPGAAAAAPRAEPG
jgi:hypothetical protein